MGLMFCPRGLKPFRLNSSHAKVAKDAENGLKVLPLEGLREEGVGLKAVRLSTVSLVPLIAVSVSRVTDAYASEG